MSVTNPTIEDLQRRLAELQAYPKSTSDIVSPPIVEVPISTPPKEISFLEAVGSALSEEEQLWVSKKEVLLAMPGNFTKFLLTGPGKIAIRAFLEYHRGNHES